MNTINHRGATLRKTLIATAVASVMLGACAVTPRNRTAPRKRATS